MNCAESITTIDQITGATAEMRYAYHDGYYDLPERESRGFGMVEQWHTETFPATTDPDQKALLSRPTSYVKRWFYLGRLPTMYRLPSERLLQDSVFDLLSADAYRTLNGLPIREKIHSDHDSEPQSLSSLLNENKNDNPRLLHDIVLEIDEYGNTTKSTSIAYGKKKSTLDDATDRLKQEETVILYAKTSYTNVVDGADGFRFPETCDTMKYCVSPGTHYDLFGYLELIANDFAFFEGVMEYFQLAITPRNLSGPLPRFIPTEYKEFLQKQAGYIDLNSDNHWWIPSSQARYAATTDSKNSESAVYDYAALQTKLSTDPNENHIATIFDSLRRAVGGAVSGKVGEEDGDSLEGFQLTTDETERFIKNPEDANARAILSKAGHRIIHSAATCFDGSWTPAFQGVISRDEHASDTAQLGVDIVYSAGSGNPAQVTLLESPQRWRCSGLTLNDSSGPNLSTTFFRDALGRDRGTLQVDHTWSKVRYTPWLTEHFDVGDTFLFSSAIFFDTLDEESYMPSWYDCAMQSTHKREKDAARKSSTYNDNTADVAHMDSLGRIIVVVQDNSTQGKYTTRTDFNLLGQMSHVANARGILVTKASFDMYGRELYRWSADSDTTIRFIYDVLNRLEGEWLTVGESEILISKFMFGESQPNASDHNLRTQTQFAEDYKGLLNWAEGEVPLPQLEPTVFLNMATYNARNQACTTTASDGSRTSRTYKINGELETLAFEHYATNQPTILIGSTDYTPDGKRERVVYGNTSQKLNKDAASRRLKQSQVQRSGRNTTTLFDSPGNGSEMCEYVENYNYDSVSSTKVGATSEAYEYNNQGCISSLKPYYTSVNWDFHNRLCSASTQSVKEGTPETTYYVYDRQGRRARKVTERATSTNGSPQPMKLKETMYLTSYQIHRTYNGDGQTIKREKQTSTVLDDGEDEPISVALIEYTPNTKETVTRYQTTEMLELDDEARVVSYSEYSLFGVNIYNAVGASIEAPRKYRFAGYERDSKTGLYHCGERYYAAWLGRWSSPDPIELAGGINRYCYVNDCPLDLSNHKGMMPRGRGRGRGGERGGGGGRRNESGRQRARSRSRRSLDDSDEKVIRPQPDLGPTKDATTAGAHVSRWVDETITLRVFEDGVHTSSLVVSRQLLPANGPLAVGLSGLVGYTALAIFSPSAVYFAHFWETQGFTAEVTEGDEVPETPEQVRAAFDHNVLDKLRNGVPGFESLEMSQPTFKRTRRTRPLRPHETPRKKGSGLRRAKECTKTR
ncbi:hypothetical protein F4860DRAFT_515392 [Xylaria cubensis]|nr:hypothetical protein F4860DRAFT_515392 [Xylaria cubensis]